MPSSITTLFVDVGGVLLTNGWDRALRKKAAERFKLDLDEMNDRHRLTFDTYEEGKISLETYLKRVVFYRPRRFSFGDFSRFMYTQARPFPDTIALVRRLKARHKLKVVVCSNEGRELMEDRIRRFKLDEFVDVFVASCFVHYRKPDEDIFRVALDIAQVKPSRVAYMDDRAMFVEVARALGVRGIHHTSAEKTREELARLGLS